MAIITQGPPEPGCELAASMVDGDHGRIVANPPNGHGLGESLRRRDLCGHRIARVGDVGRPVDEGCAGNVSGEVFLAGAAIDSLDRCPEPPAWSSRIRGCRPRGSFGSCKCSASQAVETRSSVVMNVSRVVSGMRHDSLRLATQPADLQVPDRCEARCAAAQEWEKQ